MNKFKYILTFCLGLASGYFITKKLLMKKYEEMAESEIESIREWYVNKYSNTDDSECCKEEDTTSDAVLNNEPDIDKETYENIILENNYNCDIDEDGPMVISPNEFGEDSDYDTISLSYFSDGILADDMFCQVEDIADVVGEDFASHFGEYEDDSVFVRNDRLKCYYEILLEHRTYSEAIGHE